LITFWELGLENHLQHCEKEARIKRRGEKVEKDENLKNWERKISWKCQSISKKEFGKREYMLSFLAKYEFVEKV